MQSAPLIMQRKPGFPVSNCSIKMPDSNGIPESSYDEENEQHQRRQQLINFGHSQWGFNNWNWAVTKQELDFVELSSGRYCAGVVAFVSVSVKNFDIHRENIGYATSNAANKGFAIYKSRKCAVTNALRETLLSFGGTVATELMELLEANKMENPVPTPAPTPAPALPPVQPELLQENNQNLANKPTEPKNSPLNKIIRKDSTDNGSVVVRPHTLPVKNAPVANAHVREPPVAKAHPMPANLPPAANRAPVHVPPAPRPPPVTPLAHPRPNSNVSFVLQPVMGGVVPQMYGAPQRLQTPHHHVLPQQLFPNYYEYAGPWHFAYEPYERHHGNVNLNFNMPPKNLVVNSRSGSVECKSACPRGPEGEPIQYGPAQQNQGCWIKPTIFYDGFWTEQKVKKWVAEQVEKQFPEDTPKSSSPNDGPDNSKS